ncbi:MAG: sulfite exporter TauE/SafE family protein, partial [Rhodospirillaceae bacterium]|nr:sulfite exporter TauE/SafE family protein [Rhodospirillaceae bacterium]
CAAFVTAVSGSAGGLLLLGTLALVFPPTVLIPVHTVVMLGDSVSRAAILWRHVLWAAQLPFFIGAALGALVGGQIFVTLPTATLQVILGIFIIVFTWMPKIASTGSLRGRFSLIGFTATFVGMFVSAVGALVGPFVGAACPDRRQLISTFSALMGLVHLCKLVAFGLLGVTLAPYLPLMAAMVATAVIGNLIGSRVLNRIPENAFRLIFRLVLTALALRILWLAARNAGIL